MATKNTLYLHEAIVVALINLDKEEYIASFDDIANYIERRGLFPSRKGDIPLSTQVMLRSTKAKNAYDYLFQQVDSRIIKLKLSNKVKLNQA